MKAASYWLISYDLDEGKILLRRTMSVVRNTLLY